MNSAPLPLTRDLVLIGGGHTHALVLRKWGMSPLPGARLTLINPGPTAPYSGMLPGFVAGHYDRHDLDIDLVRLARFAGARLIQSPAQDIDTDNRLIHVPDRPPVSYDVCSVDIGITSAMPELPGFAEYAVPAKPLGPFATRWGSYLHGSGPVQVVVIGAGVAGAELAMAMAYAAQEAGRSGQVTLIDRSGALTAIGAGARHKILSAIAALGITLIEGADLTAIAADHVVLDDGRMILADFVTGAAGARAYDWIARTGLDLHDGFIAVNDRLQSSDPVVFAVGDCAHMTQSPRPKAGVYAVRQAPVLLDNLCAALSGGPLRAYKPQGDYLKLISLGRKSALGERFGTTISGALMWRWKDSIDRSFMRRFHDLPQMEPPPLPSVHALGMTEAMGDKPLCGGCGAKVGRNALRAGLAVLDAPVHADITPLPGDDAALLHTGGAVQVLTSDHLRAFMPDPVMMTRIAAVHALGDIWAMGAKPQAATATLILPRMSAELHERTLREITQSAAAVLRGAGAEIVGGHTSVGDEMTIGFTLTGLCDADPITLSGGRAGDALVVTKPIGSGVIMAAEMAGQAHGAWVQDALTHMTRPQTDAATLLAGANAMTDITGFGLLGHLKGMCEASGTGAVVQAAAVPLMDGALELARAGVRSSIFADNRALLPDLPEDPLIDLLCDPQTAGGLLAAVDPDLADELVSQLSALGLRAARIGHLTADRMDISVQI